MYDVNIEIHTHTRHTNTNTYKTDILTYPKQHTHIRQDVISEHQYSYPYTGPCTRNIYVYTTHMCTLKVIIYTHTQVHICSRLKVLSSTSYFVTVAPHFRPKTCCLWLQIASSIYIRYVFTHIYIHIQKASHVCFSENLKCNFVNIKKTQRPMQPRPYIHTYKL